MTDIAAEINTMTPEDLEALKLKYEDLHIKLALQYSNKSDYLYLKVIGVASKYINKRHTNASPDLKAWITFVVAKVFEYQKIKSVREILKIINDFMKYWNENYDEYSKHIIFSCSDFDRDSPFVTKYISTKMQSY